MRTSSCPGSSACASRRRSALPLVTTFHALGRVRRIHQGASDGFPDARFEIEDALVQRSDSVIAECPQDEADLVSLYHADPANIDLVPCGFDSDEFFPMDRAEARDELGWPLDRLHRVAAWAHGAAKGYRQRRARHRHLQPRTGREGASLRGRRQLRRSERDSPRRKSGGLRGIARGCGVGEQVKLPRRRARQRLRLFYNAADVFVTTPWYEPFGITPLEAMACARPVIGADVGGIRYSVAHRRDRAARAAEGPVALAHALAESNRDPQLAERMGAAGLSARAGDVHMARRRRVTGVGLRARCGVEVTERAGADAIDARVAAGGASA